ncbi:MAG: hypothetical protein KKH98_09015 [Spirochaetes bacterium]|nr:hypothetical protein [Spirochaetota bacterium]
MKKQGRLKPLTYLKVEFLKIDREGGSAGELAGTAVWKDGKMALNIKDPELEKILKAPFRTMTGEEVKGKMETRFLTLEPGTPEHLLEVARQARGYVGIIHEEEK